MTFYLQAYPFGFRFDTPFRAVSAAAQGRPYRRVARRWVEDRDQTLGIDVREENDVYILSALVPGIKSDELNIQVLDDSVRIEAEYKAEESEGYLVRELPTGSFTRSLRLPAPIDAEHVEANVTDGVLTLRLPKAESARPKQIKIQSR